MCAVVSVCVLVLAEIRTRTCFFLFNQQSEDIFAGPHNVKEVNLSVRVCVSVCFVIWE